MTVERIILHVGTPKTGTTSLQTALVAQEEVLAKEGIRYLKSFRASVSHNRLIQMLNRGGEEAKKVRRKTLREIGQSEQSTILISTEIAYGIRPTKALMTLFEERYPGKAEIVFYVRRQDLFLEAMAKQKLKSGHYKGELDSFIAARKKNGFFMKYIKRVQKNFPGTKITCRPYDRRELLNGDIVADFMSFLGVDYQPEADEPKKSINVTPSKELAIALSLQEFASPYHRRSTISEIHQRVPSLFRSKDIMDATERKAFLEEFRQDNRALSQFSGYDVEGLFNDTVDFEKESNLITDATEQKDIMQLATDTVRDVAFELHPAQKQAEG
ncbi:hypothetical protein [uncultured Shimia sp.]|uniref:hypothetical protein n=1 Tax=uncultured Shimia sp. TaxID=573152 RepID=UPI002618E6C4|nr:hypothetical protein [uncultured Shimia sp.]